MSDCRNVVFENNAENSMDSLIDRWGVKMHRTHKESNKVYKNEVAKVLETSCLRAGGI